MPNSAYKIGIIGGGAVGLVYAALLSEVASVTIKTRRPEQAKAINTQGIRFQPRDDQTYPEETFKHVHASAEWGSLADCDALIVAVKSYDTESITAGLSRAISPEATILTLQNGLEAFPILKKHVANPSRVFAGITSIGGRRIDDRTVVIGDNRRTIIDAAAGSLVGIMKTMRFPAETTTNVAQTVWDKLVLNAGQNALSAITGRNVGEMLASPECLDIATHLLAELKAVGEAEGLTFDYDLMEKLRANWENSRFYPSMWQDVQAGRRTEIDAINGAIATLGRGHHISTPYNDMMTSLIKALQKDL